jgi:hypothetical protein
VGYGFGSFGVLWVFLGWVLFVRVVWVFLMLALVGCLLYTFCVLRGVLRFL